MEYVVEINGVKYGNVVDYKVEYNQVWQEGSTRDEGSGKWSGTLQGNFTKVTLAIIPKNKEELSELIKYLRRGVFPIKFYNHETMTYTTHNVYRANYTVVTHYLSKSGEIYTDAVALSFIPERRN